MTSTIQVFQTAISNFTSIQSDLDTVQEQIGSTSLANTFSQLGVNSANVQNYQVAINNSNRYVASIQNAETNNNQYDSVLGQVINIASSFQQNLALQNNTTSASSSTFTLEANAALGDVQSALNTQSGDIYLFAGSKTNVQPVNNLTTNTNIVNGQPTASYYSGDNYQTSVNVSSSTQVKYGVTASNPAFQQLIGAINLAKSAEASGDYTDAGNMLTQAITGLTSLRAQVDGNAATLQNTATSYTSVLTTLQANLTNLNSPDVVKLSVQSSADQTALQASFETFAQIAKLSLAQYMQ